MKDGMNFFKKKLLPLTPIVIWPILPLIERRIATMNCRICTANGLLFGCSDGGYWIILYVVFGIPLAIISIILWYIWAHKK